MNPPTYSNIAEKETEEKENIREKVRTQKFLISSFPANMPCFVIVITRRKDDEQRDTLYAGMQGGRTEGEIRRNRWVKTTGLAKLRVHPRAPSHLPSRGYLICRGGVRVSIEQPDKCASPQRRQTFLHSVALYRFNRFYQQLLNTGSSLPRLRQKRHEPGGWGWLISFSTM